MTERIVVSEVLPVKQKVLYEAWLDSDKHSAFTGSPAVIDKRVGGTFTAWDGYISGTTIMIEPFSRIIQTWRTTEFPDDAPDSEIEVVFEEVAGGHKDNPDPHRHPGRAGRGLPEGVGRLLLYAHETILPGKVNGAERRLTDA